MGSCTLWRLAARAYARSDTSSSGPRLAARSSRCWADSPATTSSTGRRWMRWRRRWSQVSGRQSTLGPGHPSGCWAKLPSPRVDATPGGSSRWQAGGAILRVPVLVLTTYDTDADIVRAVEAGATGYLLKDTTRQELLGAIRSAAAGRSALAPSVASRLVARMAAPAGYALSAREIEACSGRRRRTVPVAGHPEGRQPSGQRRSSPNRDHTVPGRGRGQPTSGSGWHLVTTGGRRSVCSVAGSRMRCFAGFS